MINWLFEMSHISPVAHTIGLMSLVCAVGMALGSIKAKGIGLGSAAVLFTGIVVGQFTEPIDKDTLDFIKEFGLVLFVFAIGLQLGPSFFESFRSDGLRLNLLAAALVALAGILTPLLGVLFGVDELALAGLFAGASTNSPALGAAQQSLSSLPGLTREQLAIPALACAVSYPIAIAGVLGTLLVLKMMFRIDPVQEAKEFAAAQQPLSVPLHRRTLVVENRHVDGLTLEEVCDRCEGVVISRIRAAGETNVRTALRKIRLRLQDVVLAIGAESALDRCQELVGRKCEEDLMLAPGDVTFRRIFVTHKRAFGRTTEQLGLEGKFGVEVTRISRGDLEMTAVPGLRLQFGDVVRWWGRHNRWTTSQPTWAIL